MKRRGKGGGEDEGRKGEGGGGGEEGRGKINTILRISNKNECHQHGAMILG